MKHDEAVNKMGGKGRERRELGRGRGYSQGGNQPVTSSLTWGRSASKLTHEPVDRIQVPGGH